MKKIILLLIMLILTGAVAQAQLPPANKPDSELTKDEATLRIQDFEAKLQDLLMKLNKLIDENEQNTEKLAQLKKDLVDCNESLLSLVGATTEQYDAFRQKLGIIEGKLRELERLSLKERCDRKDELYALLNDLNDLRQEKLALIKEYYEKIVDLNRRINRAIQECESLRPSTYVVQTWAKERDCLWNISGKIDIYGDPFLWPKIWIANKDIIRNPDIIHPGQVLEIPDKGPKSSEEIKAEQRYWRNKRAQQQSSDESQNNE